MESASEEPGSIIQEDFILIQGVDEVGRMMQRFDWPDYIVFVVMLVICIAIGIYFGFIKSAKTASEYLVGGRNMKIFPISMSLIASFVSGISLLGIPTEIYIYGTQYLYIIAGVFIMALLMQYFYLPVFHDLKLTSTFEYLEKRFNRKLRILGSFLCVIGITTWLPVVIYVPALAFNQVTGVNVHWVTPIVCLICIFYTCVGGLKAVVWTDVIQTIIMFGSMILIAVKGTIDIGGLGVVLERNMATSRIEPPDWDVSLVSRHTIWALVIGGAVYWLQTSAVNQTMIQRYLALPDLKSSKRALWTFVIGVSILVSVCGYCGLLIFATYHTCDPITTKLARQKDQLLPLLVMDVLGNIPGFPGVFVAGIFSASLSSLSTGLNSMSAVVLEDFYRPFFKKDLSERHTQIVMKAAVVIFGALFVALVQVVEKLGTVLQLTMSIGTIGSGPSLGIFTMGVLIPWVNATGALVGGITGLIFMSWMCLGAQAAIAAGDMTFPSKPTSTEGCAYHFVTKPPSLSMISNSTETAQGDELFMLYRLSYLWYVLSGVIVTTTVGVLVSFITKPNDPRDVEPGLLAPIVRRNIKPRDFPNQPPQQDIILAYEPHTYKMTHTTSSNGIPSFQPEEPSSV